MTIESARYKSKYSIARHLTSGDCVAEVAQEFLGILWVRLSQIDISDEFVRVVSVVSAELMK
jgi:hypothetical protein